MSDTVEVTWYVDDGYCNPGPKIIRLYLSDFEGLDTEEHVREAIEDAVYEDFQQSVSFYTSESSVDDAVEEIMAYLKEQEDEEDGDE